MIIILFGLSILTFGLTYLLPSDPVEELVNSMGGGHDEETIARLEAQFGTSRPFIEQYADWIKGVVLEQDFGMSVKYNEPVKDIIARKLPNTVALACTSFVVMLLIALPLGILSAIYKNHIVDYVIRFMSFIGVFYAKFLVWHDFNLDSGCPSRVAAGSRFFFMETHCDADTYSCGWNELFLYQKNPCCDGRADAGRVYIRM